MGKGKDSNWRTRHIDRALGARVRDLRNAAGLSRADLAERMRVSVSQIQHPEDGDVRFSAAQLWQICHLLEIDVSEVFEGLPTRVWKDRAEYDEWLSQRDRAGGVHVAAQTADTAFAGVMEEGSAFTHAEPAVRTDIQALAKAARSLSPDQVAILQTMIKGMKAS